MSTLQVANVVSNGTIVTNTISIPVSNLTINSTGLFVNSFPFINSSAITIGTTSTNNIIQATISEPSITVNNNVLTTISSEFVNVQIFTANGNWTKPSWAAAVGAANTSADLVIVHLWGAGGGASGGSASSSAGGSGIVILRYPSEYTISLSAGLTGTTSTVGSNKVTQITAGTGTVSWS